MSELLDLYNCQDWEMGFVEFLEKATEVTLEVEMDGARSKKINGRVQRIGKLGGL